MDWLKQWNCTFLKQSLNPKESEQDLFYLCEDLIKNSQEKVTIKSANKSKKIHLGSPLIFGTPAYWIFQYYSNDVDNVSVSENKRRTLKEEIVFCMLGGYGIPAEVAISYYIEIQQCGLITSEHTGFDDYYKILSNPVSINNRQIRYRFPKQKSERISTALSYIDEKKLNSVNHVECRNELTKIPGIGLKTSSWIIRNYYNSNEVAIIDIHLERAAKKANLFKSDWKPSKDYLKMEECFLSFAKATYLEASKLDLLIWNQVRNFKSFTYH